MGPLGPPVGCATAAGYEVTDLLPFHIARVLSVSSRQNEAITSPFSFYDNGHMQCG